MPICRPTLTHLDDNAMQLVMRHLSAVDLLHLRQTATTLRDAVDAAAPVWQALEKGCAEALSWRKLKRGHCDSHSWQQRLQRRFCTRRKGLAEAMKAILKMTDQSALQRRNLVKKQKELLRRQREHEHLARGAWAAAHAGWHPNHVQMALDGQLHAGTPNATALSAIRRELLSVEGEIDCIDAYLAHQQRRLDKFVHRRVASYDVLETQTAIMSGLQ